MIGVDNKSIYWLEAQSGTVETISVNFRPGQSLEHVERVYLNLYQTIGFIASS